MRSITATPGEDCASVEVTVREFGFTLTTAETDTLLAQLCELRPRLKPERELGETAPESTDIVMGWRYEIRPDWLHGGAILLASHPIFGWLGFQMMAQEARGFVQHIEQSIVPGPAPKA